MSSATVNIYMHQRLLCIMVHYTCHNDKIMFLSFRNDNIIGSGTSLVCGPQSYISSILFSSHLVLAGEATVDTVFDSPRWQDFPENENCPEPRITNADYIYRFMPNLKVILLLRNPVER